MSPSVAEEAKPGAKVSATCGTEHMILVSFRGGGGEGEGVGACPIVNDDRKSGTIVILKASVWLDGSFNIPLKILHFTPPPPLLAVRGR